jgi:hypothetical protein
VRTLRLFLLLLAPLALFLCAGCDLVGVTAEAVTGETDISPAYTALAGQKVAILVWADEGVSLDHPTINADIARSLLGKFQNGSDAKLKELKNTTFVDIAQVLRFQEAHPETQVDPPEQIAQQLPGSRLIYIELDSLALHPGQSIDLARGQATADVKVIEVKDSQAKVAFQQNTVSAVYPKDSPPEGVYGLSDELVYQKTIDALADQIGNIFMTHPAEQSIEQDQAQEGQHD